MKERFDPCIFILIFFFYKKNRTYPLMTKIVELGGNREVEPVEHKSKMILLIDQECIYIHHKDITYL